MGVRSKRVAGPTQCPDTGTVLYTVPAGETFRGWVQLSNKTSSSSVARLYIGATFTDATTFAVLTLGARSSERLDLVLNPGDELRGVSDTSLAVNATVMGSELEGVAD